MTHAEIQQRAYALADALVELHYATGSNGSWCVDPDARYVLTDQGREAIDDERPDLVREWYGSDWGWFRPREVQP